MMAATCDCQAMAPSWRRYRPHRSKRGVAGCNAMSCIAWYSVCFSICCSVCCSLCCSVCCIWNFSFESLFAMGSLSPQRFYYYFNLSIVSWQYQKYWTILILVLFLLCVTPLICSSYSSFAPSSSFFSSWWQRDCELFTHTLVLQCSRSTSSRQPQTTQLAARFVRCALRKQPYGRVLAACFAAALSTRSRSPVYHSR